jgi:hypothetical protein
MVDMNMTISKPNSSGNNGGNNNTTSSSSNINNSSVTGDGYYGDVYLIGSFCGWYQGNKEYPLEYKGEGTYTITFNAKNLDNGSLSWKVYDGNNFDRIDWTIEGEKLTLEGSGKSSAKIYNLRDNQKITITINTLSKDVFVEVEEGRYVDFE